MKIIAAIREDRQNGQSISPTFIKRWHADKIIECWDSLFNIKYHEYRALLHEIQVYNFSKIGFDAVVYRKDPILNEILSTPDNLILPVDNDDWFHNDICSILRSIPTDKKFIRWYDFFYYRSFLILKKRPPNSPYRSNNYCLVTPTDWNKYCRHASASKHIRQDQECFLPEILSLRNKSLSSISNYTCPIESFPVYMKSLYQFYNRPTQITRETPPCFVEYILKAEELHKRLTLKS